MGAHRRRISTYEECGLQSARLSAVACGIRVDQANQRAEIPAPYKRSMGQLANSLADMNPLIIEKSMLGDCAVYVCNAVRMDFACCGCWQLKVRTRETHPEPEQEEAAFLDVIWH